MRTVIFLLLAASQARSEWYLAGYLGAAHTASSTIDLTQPGTQLRFSDVHYQGRSFESPLYYGYRLGNFFTEHFGVDVEFTHLKVYAEDQRTTQVDGTFQGAPLHAAIPMNTIINAFSISHGVNLLTANFVARQEFGQHSAHQRGRFALIGRAGYGVTIPHPEATILGVHQEDYQIGRPVFQVSVGAEFRLRRGLSALAEYKFTQTLQNVGVPAGTIETLLRSHHVIAGLAWHF